jgi:hypothetical protein
MRNRRNLPSPPEVVRAALIDARRDGLDFERAWERRAWPAFMARLGGIKPVPRREWKLAIADTRAEWQAAYEGRQTAASLVFGADDLADVLAEAIQFEVAAA